MYETKVDRNFANYVAIFLFYQTLKNEQVLAENAILIMYITYIYTFKVPES